MLQSTITPRPQPAWDTPAWVRVLLFHPDNFDLLERTRVAGHDLAPAVPREPGFERYAALIVDTWNRDNREALRDGYTAGAVLTLLYALTRAGWTLPRGRVPSLRMAIACVAAGGEVASPRGPDDLVPTLHAGHTKVTACWKKRLHVAHLWAALTLYCQGFMGSCGIADPHDLLIAHEGVQALLATARDVQQFARSYSDLRTGKPLKFDPSPWWVPDGPHRPPVWPRSIPAHWLITGVRDYRA
jgi:hypothetical protein